jgi:hypothetical protein
MCISNREFITLKERKKNVRMNARNRERNEDNDRRKKDRRKKQEVLERSISPFLISLHYIRILYNLHYLITANYVPWLPWIHCLPRCWWLNNGSNYGTHCCTSMTLNCHTIMRCLPWLPNLTLDGAKLTGAGFVSTSKV